jgi:hypothetical protein
MAAYTINLTAELKKSIESLYPNPISDTMICVEIGSFEGRGSILIHDHLCRNASSKLLCIDPFDDEYVKGNSQMAFWNKACNGQLNRFRTNTSGYSKIIECIGTSDTQIPILVDNSVDFCYIDGDHSPDQVYKDAVNIFPKIKDGGIILFDDYLWSVNGIITRIGIDLFLKEYEGSYTLLFKNWQLAIKKLSAKPSTHYYS